MEEIDYNEVFGLEPEEPEAAVEEPEESTAEPVEEQPEHVEPEEAETPEGQESDSEEDDAYAAARRKAEQERDAALEQLRQAQARSGAWRPLLEMLGQRYGVADLDAAKLMEAVSNDPLYLEDAAERAGLTREQFQEQEQMRREIAALRRDKAESEQAARESRVRQLRDTELRKIRQIDPSVKSLEDLTRMDSYPEFVRLARLGNSLSDAYKLANYDVLVQKMADSSRQAAVNSARSKNHLVPANQPKGAGETVVPPEIVESYRQLEPEASVEEIQRLYRREMARINRT